MAFTTNLYTTTYFGDPSLSKKVSTKGRALKSLIKTKAEGGTLDGAAETELQESLATANATIAEKNDVIAEKDSQLAALNNTLTQLYTELREIITGTAVSIDIPSDTVSIAAEAFSHCSNLATIYLQQSTPPTLGADAFPAGLQHIYVPDEDAVTAYSAATGWSDYSSIIEITPAVE